jgi:Sulfotransferase family
MYSAKSASGKILYWWLEQTKLLKSAMRFSEWSHEFEETFRYSREFIVDGLTYDPQKYHTYKFVRHPAMRAASAFVHLLMFPGSFGLLPEKGKYSISFLEFLDMLENTDLMQRDGHCRPQLTGGEMGGLVRPKLLKLECGLETHFAFLERQHSLPAATFEQNPRIRSILAVHTKQPQARISAGPADRIRFGEIPISKSLPTSDVIDRIYALYRGDFEAYGYGQTV